MNRFFGLQGVHNKRPWLYKSYVYIDSMHMESLGQNLFLG